MRATDIRCGGSIAMGEAVPRGGRRTAWARVAVLGALVASAGCAAPVLSRDGQLVFSQGGARGASVLTAHGVEFLDRTEIPQPVVRRSVNEPWRPATGFLLPVDGVWRKTSTPVPVQGRGLAVVLRTSDVFIPSWGGEILLRVDAIAPAKAFPAVAASIRPAVKLAIVIDGTTPETTALLGAALDNLGGTDRVGIIDTGAARGGAHPVLPMVPGSHRTLLRAAVERLVEKAAAEPHPARRDLAGALSLSRGFIAVAHAGDAAPFTRHVLVITDGAGVSGVAREEARIGQEIQALAASGGRLTAVGSSHLSAGALASLGADVHPAGSLEQREEAIDAAIRPPGDVVLEDVELSISSVPAPARVVEVSGGQSSLALDTDRFILGDLYAGEARTEVARVMLPAWVPGEPLELTVTASYRDVASRQPQTAEALVRCRYSSDMEEIANARHGDVIAYASALAMVRRLHRAFLGNGIDRLGGLRPMVALQARSLADLSRIQRDPALGEQAEILSTLLSARSVSGD
jgi:hypothetical protein